MLICHDNLPQGISISGMKIGKGRENEKTGEQDLLREMCGYDVELSHNENGKPLIKDWNLSISHTKGFLVIILSKIFRVGIDIEYRSERVKRIAKRFLRTDEFYTNTEQLLTIWCAKETIYKLLSEERLTYQEIKVDPLRETAMNMRTNRLYPFVTKYYKDYIITYAWL